MNQRLQRTVQLGLLAKDLATVKCQPRGTSQRDAKMQRIVERLGLLHGLPQKIGQLLSFSEINLSNSASSFQRLTEDEPSLDADQAFAEIEKQLGVPLGKYFRSVHPHGISASIGQVHHAVLQDGREVAVKLQYPGIAEQINWDLEALGWLMTPIADLRQGFDVSAYRSEIGSMLRREVDYAAEAEAIRHFRSLTRDFRSLQTPEVVAELSRPRLLTTTWLHGDRSPTGPSWSLEDRQALANTLLRLFMKGIFQWGFLHADPHPGNYRFLPSDAQTPARVGLLDFGCVKSVSRTFADGLARLITESMNGSLGSDSVTQGFLLMGFNPFAVERLGARLTQLAEVLCEPFTNVRPFSASEWNLSVRLASILGSDRMTFRMAGPPELLFILRAFQGLLHHLRQLRTPVGWREAFLDCRRSESTDPGPLNKTPAPDSSMRSDTLHIQVKDGSETVVAMTFGAESARHLDQLVPLDLKAKLHHRSIDLLTVAHRAQESGYAPGELFSWQDGERSVRVWLA